MSVMLSTLAKALLAGLCIASYYALILMFSGCGRGVDGGMP